MHTITFLAAALALTVATSINAVAADAEAGSKPAGPAKFDPSRFYQAALCDPPYTFNAADDLYRIAEKTLKSAPLGLSANVYKTTEDIGQDGFKTNEVLFAASTYGVLIQGQVAEQLAAFYDLKPEKTSSLIAVKSYSRVLPRDQQRLRTMGVISVVARESNAIPGKTLLACEFVSNEDKKKLEEFEKFINGKPGSGGAR
jgi:hypothetical protein